MTRSHLAQKRHSCTVITVYADSKTFKNLNCKQGLSAKVISMIISGSVLGLNKISLERWEAGTYKRNA